MSLGRFENWKKPIIKDGKLNKYLWVVRHPKKFQLGNKVDIGSFTYIQAQEGVILEDEVQIGSHCSIYSVSTIDNKKGCVVMKKGSCLGSHSVVMPGVTIGQNAIVGAMSFVNKDVPPNTTTYGIPIK